MSTSKVYISWRPEIFSSTSVRKTNELDTTLQTRFQHLCSQQLLSKFGCSARESTGSNTSGGTPRIRGQGQASLVANLSRAAASRRSRLSQKQTTKRIRRSHRNNRKWKSRRSQKPRKETMKRIRRTHRSFAKN